MTEFCNSFSIFCIVEKIGPYPFIHVNENIKVYSTCFSKYDNQN